MSIRLNIIWLTLASLWLVGCAKEQPKHALSLPEGERGTLVVMDASAIQLTSNEFSVDSPSDDKPITFNLRLADGGITVGTVADGLTPADAELQHQGDFFAPASLSKILTAASALETLGQDFTFKTKLFWLENEPSVASHLTVQADGDPRVGVSEAGKLTALSLDTIPAQMHALGIRSLKDGLHFVATDDRLNIASVAPGVDREDYSNCYGALTQAFNYQMNCALLGMYRSGVAQWMDGDLNFSVNPKFQKGQETRLLSLPIMDSNRVIQGFDIAGTWTEPKDKVPAENPISSTRLPISSTQSWYANALLHSFTKGCSKGTCIKTAGIEVDLNPKGWNLDAVEPKIVLQSRPLSTLTHWMLKFSSAFIADSLVKAMGATYDDKLMPIREAGTHVIAEKITQWLEESGQSDLRKEIKFFDGTGFSLKNQVTPRALLALLKHWTTKPYFSHIYDGLPIAGVDGTLAHRFLKSKGKNLVRAKTGTLQGYYQMAGYIPQVKNGTTRFIPFVILTKTTDVNKGKVLALQEKIVDALVDATRTL